MFFLGSPQYKKTPQISPGRLLFILHYISDIQVELHILITIKQQPRALQVILVYVHIPEVQRYVFQWQVYLPCHEIEVVYICWQSKVRVTASLVG